MGVKIPAAFEDATGKITRLTGEIEFEVPANPGDVLTAGNPATTAAFAAGGGSTPLARTFTAAEIAARWDDIAVLAMMQWDELTPFGVLSFIEGENTLDNSVSLSDPADFFYTPGAATADVYNSGEQGHANGYTLNPETYYQWAQVVNFATSGDIDTPLPGASLYLSITGAAAPTTGTFTVIPIAFPLT